MSIRPETKDRGLGNRHHLDGPTPECSYLETCWDKEMPNTNEKIR